jgi:hypothetical protein
MSMSLKHSRVPVLLTPSELQMKILNHICSTSEATYRSLIQVLKRDRVTILQSLKSLVKYRYVEQRKINPQYEKSKIIFMPTFKGFGEAWLESSIQSKDIVNTKRTDEIVEYVQFIDSTFLPSQHTEMLQFLFSKLSKGYSTDYEPDTNNKRNLIKDSFRKGLLALIQSTEYNIDFLSKRETRIWLNKLYSSRELKEIKEHYMKIRDNISMTIERFPTQ